MSAVDGGTPSLTLPFSEFTHSRTPIIGELTAVCHCHFKDRFTAHDIRNLVLKDRTIQPAIAACSLPEHARMFDDPIDHLPNLLPKSPPQPALPPFRGLLKMVLKDEVDDSSPVRAGRLF
jgi:hypothetical protein